MGVVIGVRKSGRGRNPTPLQVFRLRYPAGGPLAEATRGEIRFTAAVVGVILNLAAFFAWHTLWPQGTADAPFAGAFDCFPVIVAVAAFVALWQFKADTMKVIGVCALVGLAYSFYM